MRKWPASVDKSAGTFILDFLAQQIWAINYAIYILPKLRTSVIAIWIN
jgi:hypothetical protein